MLDDTLVEGQPGHITDHQTISKKLNSTLDVIADYGAVGDGTTNDTAAIQAAIDTASTLAGTTKGRVTVLIPGGYRCKLVTTSTTVRNIVGGASLDTKVALRMKSGVHLRIDGELYFPFAGPEDATNRVNAIGADQISNFRISGAGRLNGGVTANTTEWLHQGIMVCGGSSFEVLDLEVVGFKGDAIRADSGGSVGTPVRSTNFRVAGNHVHFCTGQAIEINEALRFEIADNTVETNSNFAEGGGAEAIWVSGDEWRVVNNTAQDWGSSLSISSSGTPSSSDGVVSGNVFDDEINYGGPLVNVAITGNRAKQIRAGLAGAENGVTIADNTFAGASAYSISLGTAAGTGVIVEGNICDKAILIPNAPARVANNTATDLDVRCAASTVSGNGCQQLFMRGADSVTANNRVSTTTTTAVWLEAPRILVADNYIKTTASGAHGIFGVSSSTVDNSYITGNMISSASGNAINMNGPSSKTGAEQTGNKILAGTVVGI